MPITSSLPAASRGYLLAIIFLMTCCLGMALPPGKARPAKSSSGGMLLVANQGEHAVSLINPYTGEEASKFTVGVNGHEVAVSPDGRFAYVPIYGNSGVGKPGTDGSTMDVIDLEARKLAGTIAFGRPLRPHAAVFGRDGLLYVTAEIADEIEIVDVGARKIVGSMGTQQPESHMLALSPDRKRGYTANVGAGSVTVLDMVGRKPIGVIPVAKSVQRIALTPDGKRAFTSDQDTPRIAVINTATNKVESWIEVPTVSFSTAITPDGKWLLAALPKASQVAVVDLGTMKVTRTVDVPNWPSEIILRPDGGVAYVSCPTAGKVAVLNLGNWQVERLLTSGPGADGMAWVAPH